MRNSFHSLNSLTKNNKYLYSDYRPRLGLMYLHQTSLPSLSFTTEFLTELKTWQNKFRTWLKETPPSKRQLKYLAATSIMPKVFNLGGDLDLFLNLIKENNKKELTTYAHLCVDVIWNWIDCFGDTELTTIGLVQGTALGGGFEGALTFDHLICESKIKMGLPEINFNLFPGMGAFQLLSRRIGPKFAEKFMLEGKVYTSDELLQLGVIDQVTDTGKGFAAVEKYIKKDQERNNGNCAIRNLKRISYPISHKSLIEVTDFWVERAFNLSAQDMEIMQKLVDLQQEKITKNKWLLRTGEKAKIASINLRRPLERVSMAMTPTLN